MDKFHRHENCELCYDIPAFARRLNEFTEDFFGIKRGTLSDKSDAKDEHSHPDWDACTSECVKWVEQGI